MTEERTVWHFCKICEKEYSKDIRIHAECLNTFCFECIQTVSQQHSTNLCPYCQFPLPTPLSSLPLNYSLIYWNSLRNSENSTESEEITTNFSKNSSETCSEHNNHFSSYCGECNEAVCTFCILEKHPSHNLILKNEHIENIKKKWQLNVNEAKEENKSVQLFLSRDKSSIVSLIQLEKLNEEINEIETRLQSLIAKRQILMDQTNSLKKNKENINITNQYLNSFIENLPSLPFSSFLPSNYDEINKNNENNNYKNNQNSNSRANLKNFFDKENLSQIYSSIFRKKKSILSPEEKQKRTNFILQEKLILNENLTTNFPVSNCYPHTTLSMDISSKLNLIAVSSQDQIIFYDLSGNILKKFSFQKPNGISILSNHNLIAISSEIEHSVYLFDLVGILNDDQQEIRHEITNGQAIYHGAHLIYDLKYLKKRIGTYQGKGNFLFSSPRGLAFNHEKNILAVSDYGNNQIKFYHLSNEKSKSKSKFSNERPKLKIKFHSLISLSISPKQIALSDSLSQIIIIGDNETISITSSLRMRTMSLGNLKGISSKRLNTHWVFLSTIRKIILWSAIKFKMDILIAAFFISSI